MSIETGRIERFYTNFKIYQRRKSTANNLANLQQIIRNQDLNPFIHSKIQCMSFEFEPGFLFLTLSIMKIF